MAVRKPQPKPLVRCADCRHFRRDTEGMSRNAFTHEYFMGVCAAGLDPDRTRNERTGIAKAFADKKRTCNNFKYHDTKQ